MKPLTENFTDLCRAAGITHVVSVPDGYLAPLIHQIEAANDILHLSAAREEECIGIAAGLSIAGKRCLVMIQNVGFLNAIGCFTTLALSYKTPFGILIAQRGNVFDKNIYDIPKIRHWNNVMMGLNSLMTSWYTYKEVPDILTRVMNQADCAGEPAFLLLDFPPQSKIAC